MSEQTRTVVKTYFETGDVPTQTDFGNTWDSVPFWNEVNGNGFSVLSASTSIAAVSVVCSRPVAPLAIGAFVAIDPFTTSCEVRRVTAVSSATLTVAALLKAHSAGAVIRFLDTQEMTLQLYGALGDGTTNDEPAVQSALDDQLINQGAFWVAGQNKTYGLSTMLVGNSGCKLRHMSIKAKVGYAPADSTNAMLMASQGNVVAFTVVNSTDTFTTPTAHGIPSDGVAVIFKRITGASSLVAGRVYYAYNRTTFTFTVSATVGGGTFDVGSDGSGTAYCEINSLSRMYLDDVFIDGSSVAAVNGLNSNIQQPAVYRKVRIDNCPGVGCEIGGQDGYIDNLMIINCNRSLLLTGSFFKIFNYNAEQCDKAIELTTNAATNCIYGIHIEMNSGVGYCTATSIMMQASAAQNLLMESIHITCSDATQTIFKNTGTAGQVGYDLRNLNCNSSVDCIIIDDSDRGISLLAWTDFRGHFTRFLAPIQPTSSIYTDPANERCVGIGGRTTQWGGVINSQPNMMMRSGSAQTGNVLDVQNSSSVVVASITPAGNAVFGTRATPAAAPTIASTGTIAPTTGIVFISGTNTISTITAPSPISAGGGQITLIPTGLWATNTAGNIALATTAVVGKALTLSYDVTSTKWYPSY